VKVPFDKPIPWNFNPYPQNPPDAPDPCECGEDVCDNCWMESIVDHPDWPDGPWWPVCSEGEQP
jgi:hypothetical protein